MRDGVKVVESVKKCIKIVALGWGYDEFEGNYLLVMLRGGSDRCPVKWLRLRVLKEAFLSEYFQCEQI